MQKTTASKPRPPATSKPDCLELWNRDASLELRRQLNLSSQTGSISSGDQGLLILRYEGEIERNAAVGSATDPELADIVVRAGDCLIVTPGNVLFALTDRGWIPTAPTSTRATEEVAPDAPYQRFGEEAARLIQDDETNAVVSVFVPVPGQSEPEEIGTLAATDRIPTPGRGADPGPKASPGTGRVDGDQKCVPIDLPDSSRGDEILTVEAEGLPCAEAERLAQMSAKADGKDPPGYECEGNTRRTCTGADGVLILGYAVKAGP